MTGELHAPYLQVCPKCGRPTRFSRQYLAPHAIQQVQGQIIFGECMIRERTTCGYAYGEPCADAE